MRPAASKSESKSGESKEAKTENKPFSIPADYYCQFITSEVLFDPVVAMDGFTYEREAIERWLIDNDTSPTTGAVLPNKGLAPNIVIRQRIQTFLEAHPAAWSEVYIPKIPFQQAIEDSDSAKLKELLKKDARYFLGKNEDGKLFFHQVCEKSSAAHLCVFLKILANHPDKLTTLQKETKPAGWPPQVLNECLFIATKENDEVLLTQALALGANPNAVEDEKGLGELPLLYAANGGYLPLVKKLLANGANPKVTMGMGRHVLHAAARANRDEVLRWLLTQAAIAPLLNQKDIDGQATALELAVKGGHTDAAEVLLKAGADYDIVNGEGDYPFHTAAKQGHLDIIRLLMSYQADAYQRNIAGKTPSEIAIACNTPAIARFIEDEDRHERRALLKRMAQLEFDVARLQATVKAMQPATATPSSGTQESKPAHPPSCHAAFFQSTLSHKEVVAKLAEQLEIKGEPSGSFLTRFKQLLVAKAGIHTPQTDPEMSRHGNGTTIIPLNFATESEYQQFLKFYASQGPFIFSGKQTKEACYTVFVNTQLLVRQILPLIGKPKPPTFSDILNKLVSDLKVAHDEIWSSEGTAGEQTIVNMAGLMLPQEGARIEEDKHNHIIFNLIITDDNHIAQLKDYYNTKFPGFILGIEKKADGIAVQTNSEMLYYVVSPALGAYREQQTKASASASASASR